MGKKTCIFCGFAPEEKNSEHILPQWLLSLTGDPSRTGFWGPNYRTKLAEPWEFSFSSFKFPSCTSCNSEFSKIEGYAKNVLDKLLSGQNCTVLDFDVLMDWLDKVRTGVWLGLMMLNGNPLEIGPRFHVSHRVGAKDRLVLIGRSIPGPQTLRVVGGSLPCFQMMPSCLGLIINHLAVVSISSDFLLASRLGLPAPITSKIRADGLKEIQLGRGMQRSAERLSPVRCDPSYAAIGQPILGYAARADRHLSIALDAAPEHDTQYCRDRTLDPEKKKGAIFFDGSNSIEFQTDPSATIAWQRKFVGDRELFIRDVAELVGRTQIRFFESPGDLSLLAKEQRSAVRKLHRSIVETQKQLLKRQ